MAAILQTPACPRTPTPTPGSFTATEVAAVLALLQVLEQYAAGYPPGHSDAFRCVWDSIRMKPELLAIRDVAA